MQNCDNTLKQLSIYCFAKPVLFHKENNNAGVFDI